MFDSIIRRTYLSLKLGKAMHFKRHKPRSARAGCKLCKPWKKNGCHHPMHRDKRLLVDATKQINTARLRDAVC